MDYFLSASYYVVPVGVSVPFTAHFYEQWVASLKGPCCCPHYNAQFGGDLAYAKPLSAKLSYLISFEDSLWAVWWKILAGTTTDGFPGGQSYGQIWQRSIRGQPVLG